ncbi:hypothetical protein PR048_028828 [Dryococelus australis]|uniref:Uncharacterized protein n=1 Tax=Dryococelus australis TaxID=614101 RepID=A0ABQ9GFC4_9NEOP|nr:hypothetical protein PR048_028828 [Dryococelus australis]
MMVIEGAGETEDPRENPPTNGIVRHDSHMRKSGGTRPVIEPESPWWEASRTARLPPKIIGFHPPPPGRSRIFACGNRARTMPQVDAFSRGYPDSPTPAFILIGSHDLVVKSRFQTSQLNSTSTPVVGVEDSLGSPRGRRALCTAEKRSVPGGGGCGPGSAWPGDDVIAAATGEALLTFRAEPTPAGLPRAPTPPNLPAPIRRGASSTPPPITTATPV